MLGGNFIIKKFNLLKTRSFKIIYKKIEGFLKKVNHKILFFKKKCLRFKFCATKINAKYFLTHHTQRPVAYCTPQKFPLHLYHHDYCFPSKYLEDPQHSF